MKFDRRKLSAESWLAAAGRPDQPGSPLNVPMLAASNYLLGGERSYSRDDGTISWLALEELIGGLEGGECVAFSSGMAAGAAVFDQLATGATVVIPDDCYQGIASLAQAGAGQGRWRLERIAIDDTAAWVKAAGSVDLLWLESPSNPLLGVADLAAICSAERKPGAICAVDNTFATPLNQQPLSLGANVSMQSATKYIGGHSDLLSGLLASNDPALLEGFRQSRTLGGATPGALEAFLTLRGARTLALRLERSQNNAGLLARYLEQHPAVEVVRYPGLASHPTHVIAAAQLRGFGSVLSFDVREGADAADTVCRNLKLISHATSLGGVESTIERRGAIPGLKHLPPSLLRLSVGIESFDDLKSDLEQALATI